MKNFTRFFGESPDKASCEDLRRFRLDMVSTSVSATPINATITGLRFFFEVTLDRADAMKRMRAVSMEQKIPTVLREEEVTAQAGVHQRLRISGPQPAPCRPP